MLGVSLLKFQHILSKATCENCLHVVAENNTYYYVICLRTGVTFWHGDMLWVILASAGSFRCPPFAGEGGALDARRRLPN